MSGSEVVDVSSIPEAVKHKIVYEWVKYHITLDELANKYGLNWEQVFEIIKSAPTKYLWTKPKI